MVSFCIYLLRQYYSNNSTVCTSAKVVNTASVKTAKQVHRQTSRKKVNPHAPLRSTGYTGRPTRLEPRRSHKCNSGQQVTQADQLASSFAGTIRTSPVPRLHRRTHSPRGNPTRLAGQQAIQADTHAVASPDRPLPSHGPSTTSQMRPIPGPHATPTTRS
jgi:hypothetical protein